MTISIFCYILIITVLVLLHRASLKLICFPTRIAFFKHCFPSESTGMSVFTIMALKSYHNLSSDSITVELCPWPHESVHNLLVGFECISVYYYPFCWVEGSSIGRGKNLFSISLQLLANEKMDLEIF